MADPELQYFLAIDNGTQSVRAMLFDQFGELHAKSQIDIEPYQSPKVGWAEQQASYYWQVLCRACERLWCETDIPRAAIKAVSVTTQRATVVPLDQHGQPVRPAITWLDQRRVDTRPSLRWWESLAVRVTGDRDTIDEFHARAQANWIAQNEPDLWSKTDKLLLLSGYHIYRLTGKFKDAIASQVGYVPFDFKQLQWAAANNWQWRALPVTLGMLPELVPAGGILGHISGVASEETGIPQGLPLVASGSDKACELLGSGCVNTTIGSLSYGTTATFNLFSERYVEGLPPYPPYPGVIPGTYNIEVAVPRGYWMVSWFRREFGLLEEQLAAVQGLAPEVLFDDLLSLVPPGSMGLTLQPYWSGGPGATGPEAKGAIVGFGDIHTRAHIYRALIEGLTYALREGMETVVKRAGAQLTTLRVSGGGSQSDQIMQMTADIFGLPVERSHTFETSGLGAAMAAALGAGVYPDFRSATAAMVHPGKRFMPIPAHQKLYDQLFREVYQKIYPSLRPRYRAIQEITGYPQ
ncbi:MAG: FGGY-family carbohydrate kinase [Halieaceae bacterium]|jgi:sugar (pentulose or hexulose) kinase|uniref:FGGY-family carbohydrate kinase n=1 Tax=Haliea alexandrii TaxID=2448162 RepID=UPI000F0B5CD1|nr:FGGY-family carbohydrate kinase [Haliea alexandrii]MCR9184005.1 FGGY-family carbohydrate kinase [Halieaceae bacterium]